MKNFYDLLERVYEENRQALFTCALAITRRHDLAEDALQEAFARLLHLRKEPQNLKAYAFGSVRNAAIDQLRRNPMAGEPANGYIFQAEDRPDEHAAEAEFHRRVKTVLLSLAENERETIVQHLYAGLTFREIAEIQEQPLGTVTAQYHRGMEKLRKRIEGEYE